MLSGCDVDSSNLPASSLVSTVTTKYTIQITGGRYPKMELRSVCGNPWCGELSLVRSNRHVDARQLGVILDMRLCKCVAGPLHLEFCP